MQARLALEAVGREAPDVVLLDVLMPELDGLAVCRALRAMSDQAIIFLSSRGEELDRVLGLELGGDDYVTKPFSSRELVSRVKAVLRRRRPPAVGAVAVAEGGSVLQRGAVRLDRQAHRVWVAEEELALTLTEFGLLQCFLEQPGRAFTREDLVKRVYEGPHFVSDRTVDSHLRNLRRKMRSLGVDPIETVHGLGYRWAGP